MNRNFAILGGDARQLSLAARLLQTGGSVHCFGLPRDRLPCGVLCFENWQEAVKGADVVILPLPASPDSVRIHMPLSSQNAPTFLELLSFLPPTVHLIGGKFTPSMRALAEEQGRELFDYSRAELFQKRNAIPTAEGAVSILMERETRTVYGLSVAITGFGRVGRALAALLISMGAKVTVAARRESALSEACALGCETVRLCGEGSLAELVEGKAAIFNTVPHWIFGKTALSAVSKDALLVDLASSPGGFDTEATRGLSLGVIYALSLPGKYAPVTAGEIIAETVLSYLEKEVGE